MTMDASGSSESSLEMDERPSKRPCLQAPCDETSELPTTPLEDGNDFYDTPPTTTPPARAEEPRILAEVLPLSNSTTTAVIPGLGMLLKSVSVTKLDQEDCLDPPTVAEGEPAGAGESEVEDAAGPTPSNLVAGHVELAEQVRNELDSSYPPSHDQADELDTGDEVGTKELSTDTFSGSQYTGVNGRDVARDSLEKKQDSKANGELLGTPLEAFKDVSEAQSLKEPNGDFEMVGIEDQRGTVDSLTTPNAAGGEPGTDATVYPTLDSTTEYQILPDLCSAVEPTVGRQILPNLGLNLENPEWEADSSPYQSSSSSISSDSSSDSSSDDEDDYQLLSPSEQVRILMQEERGSDDEDQGDSTKLKDRTSGPSRIRTTNEKPDIVIPIPDITLSNESKITPLGVVEGEVENTLLVKASVTGDYQVLESGSVVCLSDRSVIGVVSETLGRVQQPLYTVRFPNAEAIRERVAGNCTEIFYVDAHSTFVFTQALKAIKGSDASNIHDEEVGDHDVEFSDDEKEAEHKRQLKLKKRDKRGGEDGFARPRGGLRQNGHGHRDGAMEVNYDDDGSMINYDDEVGSATNRDGVYEEGYTPLARPSNLYEMMGNREPPQESWAPNGNQRLSIQIHTDADRGRGHSRGGPRGRRGRDGQQRGRGREGRSFENRRNMNYHVEQRQPYARAPPSHSSNITQHSHSNPGQQYYEANQAHGASATPALPHQSSFPQYPTTTPTFNPYHLSSPHQPPTHVAARPSSQPHQTYPSQGQIRFHNNSQSQAPPYQPSGSPLAPMSPYPPPPGSHVNPAFFAGFQHQQRQDFVPYPQSAQPSSSGSSLPAAQGPLNGQAQGTSQGMGVESTGGAAGGSGGNIPDILRRLGSGSQP